MKPGTAIPLSNMRRVIAKRLSESVHTAPHFYVSVEIDMDAAVVNAIAANRKMVLPMGFMSVSPRNRRER